MRRRTVLVALALLILASIVGLSLATHARPASGPVNGRLRPCPDQAICTCSQDTDERHAIAPLELLGDPDEAFAGMVGRLSEDHELLLLEDEYAHIELHGWFGFRSDLELLLDREARLLHVRVCARIGNTDLGASRRRIEALRAELLER